MDSSVQEILDMYERTVFYPYGFTEQLLDRERKLLDEIEKLKNQNSNNSAEEK